MLRWFFVFGFLFLAACQQAPGGGKAQPTASSLDAENDKLPDDWSTEGAGTKSKYFAAEQEDIGKRMAAGLFGNCYKHAGDEAALDGCLREGLVDAFDDSGQGRRNCKSLSDLDAFTDCVILGNAAVDMLRRMDSKVELEPADWSGRRAFADAMGKVVVTAGIMACGDAKTEASAEICLFDWLETKLAVPEKLARKCSADLVARERGGCLGQATIIRFMQEHIARIPGIGV
jgi:hypothetical protein